MAFDNFNARLKEIAERALSYCRARYGGNGLRVEEGIHNDIRWTPTFFVRPSRFLIVAFEVDDHLYPESLKGAVADIQHFDSPIAVYQVCSLDAYQNDPKQTRVNLLRRHGFGMITVDSDGRATLQHPCVPLVQHISQEQLETELGGLSQKLKVAFRNAHVTYVTSEGQGLQQAGQIVEALITCITKKAVADGTVPANTATATVAEMIDALYATNKFRNHRAALGGARDFTREFRNIASHAPRSAQQAAEKIRKCKNGFFEAIALSKKLRDVAQQVGCTIRIHTT